MIKSFLILISFQISLFSSQQVILVVADSLNATKAKLSCYEGNKTIISSIDVNIGKNGLGWGIGEIKIPHNNKEAIKIEGDNKAPIGVFKLTAIFGYSHKHNFSMPYFYTSKKLICVDDSKSNFYNEIIEMKGNEKSFEYMKRDDKQYELGIVVNHNAKAIPNRGSCIFLHVQKNINLPTAGCTSMKLSDIKKIANWLDKKKNPILIQIPKNYRKKINLPL